MTMNIRIIHLYLYAIGALTVFTFIRMSGDDWAKPREEARSACEAARNEGRIYSVSYPKSGDPKKNFYGRRCELIMEWKHVKLYERKDGDYKTYEELNKADDILIRKYYYDGRVKDFR